MYSSDVYDALSQRQKKLAVVGMGYVGLPLAAAFSQVFSVIGFDINEEKIKGYQAGIDATEELGNEALSRCTVEFTTQEAALRQAAFVVVAVPTPINGDKMPDLSPVIGASRTVGRNLQKGAIVVYESTVYPGVTEEVCVPILEQESGLVCGRDFKVGYSPERINPGDKVHRLPTIQKIVSGMDIPTREEICKVYGSIITAGTYPVSSIKTAEAIKLVENSQRDINIAFMNEMAMVFDLMGIDTNEVVDGMNTKWNALGFRPGLVGGHCIGVDPYYFVYEAARLGYTSRIVSAGRQVNDQMGNFVADMTVKKLLQAKINPLEAKVVILGLTFKENCPDIRNTRVIDIIRKLQEYGIHPVVADPWADPQESRRSYDIKLTPIEQIQNADCIIQAVNHRQFQEMGFDGLCKLFRTDGAPRVLMDVKGAWPVETLEQSEVLWWRL